MSVTSDRSEILVEISAVEQKLSELKAETRLAEEKLNSLKHTLQNLEGFQSVGTDPSTPGFIPSSSHARGKSRTLQKLVSRSQRRLSADVD